MTSVQNQGNQQIQTIQPQIKPQIQAQPAQQAPAQVIQPPPLIASPNNHATAPAVQTAPPPSYAGVNIQIYNPSVGIPNINPTGNMPQSQALPGIAYPSNYYTQNYGLPQNVIPQGGIVAQGGQGGNATINNYAGGISDGSANWNNKALTDNNANANNTNNSENASNITTTSTTTKETNETTKTETKKKTEKRKVVELTDQYIKNLENYLNSQDKEVRMMGAKEVIARLQEDDSRKDDPALTALINKMLQDPSQEIRILALSMLDSRTCTGNDYTVNVLKKMQNSQTGYGQDAMQATNILLKMSGNVVEKEFEVPENSAKK